MCGIPQAYAGLQIVNAVTGYRAGRAMARYQEQLNQVQTTNARNQRNYNLALNNLEREEARQALAEKQQESFANVRRAQATAVTSAGEAGVAVDGSVAAILQELGAKGGKDVSTAMTNYRREVRALDTQMQNIFIQEQNVVNNLPTVQKPSAIGAALQIGEALYTLKKTPNSTTNKPSSQR